jgi:hypothetical protein
MHRLEERRTHGGPTAAAAKHAEEEGREGGRGGGRGSRASGQRHGAATYLRSELELTRACQLLSPAATRVEAGSVDCSAGVVQRRLDIDAHQDERGQRPSEASERVTAAKKKHLSMISPAACTTTVMLAGGAATPTSTRLSSSPRAAEEEGEEARGSVGAADRASLRASLIDFNGRTMFSTRVTSVASLQRFRTADRGAGSMLCWYSRISLSLNTYQSTQQRRRPPFIRRQMLVVAVVRQYRLMRSENISPSSGTVFALCG